MRLDGLSFLYLGLPLALLLTFLTPPRGRALTLLLLSIGWYLTVAPQFLGLLLGLLLFDWVMAWVVGHAEDFPWLRTLAVLCSVGKTVGLVVLYGLIAQWEGVPVPFGLTVAGLTSTGYVIDCYFGWAKWEQNPVPVLCMSLFFPKLYAGPLVSYSRICPQLREPRMSLEQVGEGGGQFLRGLAKKVVLGDTLYSVYQQLYAFGSTKATTLSVWVQMLTLGLMLYFLLSGYCDMGKGLARMFGFDLPDNFAYPFRSKSVGEFLGRFNGTVHRYLRRYLFARFSSDGDGGFATFCNLALVCMLAGFWFGIRLNFLLWGLALTFFVVFERFVMQKYIRILAPFFRWLYCLAAISICFAFFAGDTPAHSGFYLSAMFGFAKVEAANSEIFYLLLSNQLSFALALFCASGLPGVWADFVRSRLPKLFHVYRFAELLVLLCLSTTFLL